MEVETFIAPCL